MQKLKAIRENKLSKAEASNKISDNEEVREVSLSFIFIKIGIKIAVAQPETINPKASDNIGEIEKMWNAAKATNNA